MLVLVILSLLSAPLTAAVWGETPTPKRDLTGAAELVSALQGHIMQGCRCPAENIDIRSVTGVAGLQLPQGDASFRVFPKTAPANYHGVLLGVEAVSGGNPVLSFWVIVDASVRGRFVKAKRRIPYGAVLAPEDVALVEEEVPDVRAEYIREPERVAGKVARRVLDAGAAVTRDALSDPFLVRSGDVVRLRVERVGIVLSALARAEQNGRLGQVVRVRNLEFERPLKARVVAPGEVRID